MWKTFVGLGLVCSVMFLFMGCGGGPEVKEEKVTEPEYPEWIDQVGSAYSGEAGGGVFYGVGSSSGIRNKSLARTTAANRARAEIAKIFDTYTAYLMKDYAASTTAGDFESSSEEQHVEQVIKTFTKGQLSGVEIVEWYHDRPDATIYALARMDLNRFQDSMEDYLNNSKELSATVRERVKENAKKAFDDLETEEAK